MSRARIRKSNRNTTSDSRYEYTMTEYRIEDNDQGNNREE
jgi:hypothetical protein